MFTIHINNALLDENSNYAGGSVVHQEQECDIKICKEMDFNETQHCDFIFGTIEDMRKAIKFGFKDNISYWNLKVSDFLPHITDQCVNYQDSYFKMVCQLNKEDVGRFCRSDSGNKVWAGQLLDEPMISIIKSKCQPDDMMFLAPAKDIRCEMRCWVIEEKIIHCCRYHSEKWGEYNNIVEMIGQAEEFIKLWTPGEMCVMDICRHDGEVKIVEYNCWSSSGFYIGDVWHIALNTMLYKTRRN